MIGAVIGDIVGSYWEGKTTKGGPDLFLPESQITDDSILSIATASAILHRKDYTELYRHYANKYPNYGYGSNFMDWVVTPQSYLRHQKSYGNGAAMRVGPIGWAFNSVQDVLMQAQQSASITHCHPEGIKGAQATALCVFLARKGHSKDDIREVIQDWFEYDLIFNIDDLAENYKFEASCQKTVPQAIFCALYSNSFEETMLNGLKIGGDTDTLLAIAGSIAEPLYGIPDDMRSKAEEEISRHSHELLGTLKDFERKYGKGLLVKDKLSFTGSLMKLIKLKYKDSY